MSDSFRMPNFRGRHGGPEIMDDPVIAPAQLRKALAELRALNRFLGGHSASTRTLQRFVRRNGLKKLSILDVGTGAGDYPVRFVAWGESRNLDVRVTAIDISNEAIHAAEEHAVKDLGRKAAERITFVAADALDLPFDSGEFDVCTAALFFHHLSNGEAVAALRDMRRIARYGVLINDIHRSPAAYVGLVAVTRLLRFSDVVRHDGPVSVLRAFRAAELQSLAAEAGITKARITWNWAFRWILTDLI